MKAKELYLKHEKEAFNKLVGEVPYMEFYPDFLDKAIKEYAKQKCIEQRKIMIDAYKEYTDINALNNAPLPKFE